MKMNWDRIEGNWKQIRGSVKEQWGKLSDDQLDTIAGKRDQLVGTVQANYGIAKDVADRFRRSILERGGTEHPMSLYKEFRGREPDPDALLRRCQLI